MGKALSRDIYFRNRRFGSCYGLSFTNILKPHPDESHKPKPSLYHFGYQLGDRELLRNSVDLKGLN